MLKLFAELSHEERISAGLDQLQSCSVEFQEIMNSIHEDPFVFSLLERRRGQKGFRDLQGDSLQQGLETILEILVRTCILYMYSLNISHNAVCDRYMYLCIVVLGCTVHCVSLKIHLHLIIIETPKLYVQCITVYMYMCVYYIPLLRRCSLLSTYFLLSA